jgi:hypothetical protein
MAFRNRNRQFNRLLAMGMMLLATAGISRISLQHHAFFTPNLSDGIIGLLYGMAFGCIFLGFRQNRRRCAAAPRD